MKKQKPSYDKTIESRFISRKEFLEEFGLDTQANLPKLEIKETKNDTAPIKQSFEKTKGSNPKEIRRQFLQHSMGVSGSGPLNQSSNSSTKLRPAKDVLQRLKYDSEYNLADYVVGCIDRKAGVLEKEVGDWKSFDEEELIAYFKNVVSGEIVWEKARKIDLVFGKTND
jgi:hypothetical protein